MQPVERGALTRLVMDNLPLKFLAVVLSVALFSLVHSDTDAQRSIYVDVVALLPPAHAQRLLVSSLPTQVKLTLRGSRSRLSALQHDDFAPIQVDLREGNRRSFYFDAASIDVPVAAQVTGIEPTKLDLVWAASTERKVPVRARLRGAPEEGYMVKKPVGLSPATVTITGPVDAVKAITEVFTEELAVDGLGAGLHDRRAQLEPLHGHVTYLEQSASDVHIEIVPELGERVLRRLTVAALGAGDVNVRPNTVSVTLRGPVRALADLEPEELVPYVELGSVVAGSGTQSLDVRVRGVPEGFEVARVMPSAVLIQRKK
ncbi:MAG TPA: CdaR family protein [Polyangiales bacterium]